MLRYGKIKFGCLIDPLNTSLRPVLKANVDSDVGRDCSRGCVTSAPSLDMPSIAQLEEREPVTGYRNLEVAGSIPARRNLFACFCT